MRAPYALTPLALALAFAATGLTSVHAQEVQSLNPITVSGEGKFKPRPPK